MHHFSTYFFGSLYSVYYIPIIILLVCAFWHTGYRCSNLPCWLRKLLCRCPLNGFPCHQFGGSPRILRSHGSQQRRMLVLTIQPHQMQSFAVFLQPFFGIWSRCLLPGQGHSQLCARWLVGLAVAHSAWKSAMSN